MSKPSHKIRIIGGQWRGRKLTVLNYTDLRPSSDRIRETLFNWLMPVINGAHCLDLFAGTGALGIEAASRYADKVVLIEKNPHIARHLQQQIQSLKTDKIQLINTDALYFLNKNMPKKFNIVFIDPPFNAKLLAPTLQALQTAECLAPHAHIYIEQAVKQTIINYPKNWQLIKQKDTKQVSARLFKLLD